MVSQKYISVYNILSIIQKQNYNSFLPAMWSAVYKAMWVTCSKLSALSGRVHQYNAKPPFNVKEKTNEDVSRKTQLFSTTMEKPTVPP